MFNLLFLTNLALAINVPYTQDVFDESTLVTEYKKPKEDKYKTLLEKQKYEKLLSYFKDNEALYSQYDRNYIHKTYYTPARIAYTAVLNTSEDWKECLVEIPKSAEYAKYRMQYSFLENAEHARTVSTQSFEEWSWFLNLYTDSPRYKSYLDEYESFHFHKVSNTQDIEALLTFLQEHPKGKHYDEVFALYNTLLIAKCKEKYELGMASSKAEDIARFLNFFQGVFEQATEDVKKEIVPWFVRLKIKKCENQPSKMCYEEFLEQNKDTTTELRELALGLYEAFMFTTSTTITDWEFFLQRFPLSTRIVEAKQAYRDVRFQMIVENKASLDENSISFAETFRTDYTTDTEDRTILDIIDTKLFAIASRDASIESWNRYIDYPFSLSRIAEAKLQIGQVYYRDYTSIKNTDPKSAPIEYLTKACKESYFQACLEEGEYLLNVSATQAIKQLQLACDNTIDAACIRLFSLYDEGKLVKKNTATARQYLLYSCERNGAGCDRLLDMWEKDAFPIDSKFKLSLANKAIGACSDSRQSLCGKAADVLIGHTQGYSAKGDVGNYFASIHNSFSFLQNVDDSKNTSKVETPKGLQYQKGEVVYFCMGSSLNTSQVKGFDGQSVLAHKVVINSVSEKGNRVGISFVDLVGKRMVERSDDCRANSCFDLENIEVDSYELSPTLTACGSTVREIQYLSLNDADKNSETVDAASAELTVEEVSWIPKGKDNISYEMSLPIFVPQEYTRVDREMQTYMANWLQHENSKQRFAFDGVDSLQVDRVACDDGYEVCVAEVELSVYRNANQFREPIRLERLVHAYELYNTVCTSQLQEYQTVDKGDTEEWACFNTAVIAKAIDAERSLLKVNSGGMTDLPLPYDQLVSRRCLLESDKKLPWEQQSCELAHRSLYLLDPSYMKVLNKSCAEKNYKACGVIGKLEYLGGNTTSALPKLKQACEHGDKESCERSYIHYNNAGDVLKEYFGIKACNLGSSDACFGVAVDYWNQATKLYREANRYQDIKMLTESNSFFSNAHTYSSKGCGLDNVRACLLYGYSLSHKGDKDAANKQYDKVCHQNESKGCSELYATHVFGSKYNASGTAFNRNRSSQRALLKGVKGYSSKYYDRVVLQFDEERKGTPAVTTNLKYDKDHKPYIEVVMENTEGVIVRGAKMTKSYPSNSVSANGVLVKKVSNLGDVSGISENGSLKWQISLAKEQFSHIVILTSKQSTNGYNEVYIDIVY